METAHPSMEASFPTSCCDPHGALGAFARLDGVAGARDESKANRLLALDLLSVALNEQREGAVKSLACAVRDLDGRILDEKTASDMQPVPPLAPLVHRQRGLE